MLASPRITHQLATIVNPLLEQPTKLRHSPKAHIVIKSPKLIKPSRIIKLIPNQTANPTANLAPLERSECGTLRL